MESIVLLGTALGLSFVVGLRPYAGVFAIGFGLRTGLIPADALPAALAIVANPVVLTVAGLLFLVEVLAEKIPWLDSAWHSINAIIAPLAAALIGSTVFADLPPAEQAAAFLLSGGVGLTAAAGKTALRLTAPEPISKLGVSLGEDGLFVFTLWFTVQHPLLSILLVTMLLLLTVWLIRTLLRLLARTGRSLKSLLWRPQATSQLQPKS